jgi:hypothetical protein
VALGDKFTQAKTTRKGPPCSVGVLLSSMTKDDREALIAALADPSIESRTIWRVLIDEGHEISDTPIGRHRNGVCQCSRQDLPS